MERSATSYHSQGLVKALKVLKVLGAQEKALSLAELSVELELPKSTLIRLLSVLEQEAFVYREGDPPVYALGHAVLDISESYRRVANTADVAAPYLKTLAHATGLTANLGVLEGRWALHLCVQEPDRPLRFRSRDGSLDYTYCTGIGKMLLSEIPVDQISQHLPEEPYARFTEYTIVNREQMDANLDTIRERGYSLDDQERDLGVICLAVPIPLGLDVPVAISVSGPAGELAPELRESLSQRVHDVAAELAADPRFVAAFRAERGGQRKGENHDR
ncbi:IclR family transcriptional regulator [Salinibacterium sp. SWN248]|uniref:IclR family transcriptional regulator n=1 Tax=Salinibacterium sp. SWN248 TaxID=2792056 RepID=UPI0018CF2B70|nr:IclR family transcriptional regulator [Salinibacterium sp. SWN248]MBH0024339.1 IclR family transcriptional regulator [Salinibacterium sp. SWN248]